MTSSRNVSADPGDIVGITSAELITVVTYPAQLFANSNVMQAGQATAMHCASEKIPPCSLNIIVNIAAVPPPRL